MLLEVSIVSTMKWERQQRMSCTQQTLELLRDTRPESEYEVFGTMPALWKHSVSSASFKVNCEDVVWIPANWRF